jgi:hypothetical protein
LRADPSEILKFSLRPFKNDFFPRKALAYLCNSSNEIASNNGCGAGHTDCSRARAFDQGEVCATRKRLEIEDRSSIAARFAPQRIAIPINSNQRLPIRELRIKRLASATRLRTAAQLSICSIACQYAKICALRFFLTRVLFGHKLVTASQLYASLRSAVTSQRNCTPLETVLPTVFRAERTQSEKLNKTLTRTSA